MAEDIQGVGGIIIVDNFDDADGNPAGGSVSGMGFDITWQNGPVNRDGGELPSGAFVEDVALGLVKRMEYYQAGRFSCDENQEALECFQRGFDALMSRRKDRANRGVLGKHAE